MGISGGIQVSGPVTVYFLITLVIDIEPKSIKLIVIVLVSYVNNSQAISFEH